MPPRLTRRSVLLAGAAVALVGVSSCADSPSTRTALEAGDAPMPQRILLAYFSRAGENYWYGGRRTLDVGNTEVVAGLIAGIVACDVHRIEAAEPYPEDYDDTVARNVQEQDADARPAIAGPLPRLEQYDTILLGSPVWNVRPPMVMSTFLDAAELSGKTILPFTTHAMSGLGTVLRDYARLAPAATLGDGLAVQGEEAADAAPDIERWLRGAGLLPE